MHGKSRFPLVLFLVVIISVITVIFLSQPKPNAQVRDQAARSAILNPPSLLPDIFPWTPVPESEIKTNKNVLMWQVDLRECRQNSTTSQTCRFPDKYYRGSSTLTGSEWVFSKQINSREEDTPTRGGLRMIELAKKINWSNAKYQVKPGYSFTPAQGFDDPRYLPECIYGLDAGLIRIACMTTIVPEENTTGGGMSLRFVYPLTREIRFFISEPISISTLLSELKLKKL